MSDEEFWKALDAWRNSEEYKNLERACEIHEQAERIYQQALAAMHPIRIYTTDNTKDTRS